MRSFYVGEKASGKRIDKLLQGFYDKMPLNAMHKAFRKKDIKINGIRVKENAIVEAGDFVEVYVVDKILFGEDAITADVPINGVSELVEQLDVVYEDQNIIVVNKAQGISVHADEGESDGNTLIDVVRRYLQNKGEYSAQKGDFEPQLCHRLDRNTGGLLIVAKNSESLDEMLDMIRNRKIRKFYVCLAKGLMHKKIGELKAYISKDEDKSRVFVSDRAGKDKLEIVTRFRVLRYCDGGKLIRYLKGAKIQKLESETKQESELESATLDLTYVEVELITGRTHQIRAHLAHIGHPLLGDGKYGVNMFNRKFGMKQQVLWSYKIVFDFKNEGKLGYLSGKTIEVDNMNMSEVLKICMREECLKK